MRRHKVQEENISSSREGRNECFVETANQNLVVLDENSKTWAENFEKPSRTRKERNGHTSSRKFNFQFHN